MSIGIVYERAETDEIGIKVTAEEMGIDLVYTPFRKIAIQFDENGYSLRSRGKDYSQIVENIAVVLNRTQSKNRRLFATNILETFGKPVINPSEIEFACFSKLRTLLQLSRAGIRIPRTVFIPCDAHETTIDKKEIHNEEEIADLLQLELGKGEIVIKPDAGTHGKEVTLVKNREDLSAVLEEIEPSIINPIGILAQEFVHKWFYDLRIIVSKERRKAPNCHPVALGRGGYKDFRTNSYLGNLVFAVSLPMNIRDEAVRCGEAIGRDNDAWLLAFDAMIEVGEDKIAEEEYINSELDKAAIAFEAVKKVKRDKTKKTNFAHWNQKLEEAFQNYKNSEAYGEVKRIIEESVERNKHKVMFHEANSCPEFWEQTRNIAEINLAVPLLKCAQSVIDTGIEVKK